jgi:hypothetical protein
VSDSSLPVAEVAAAPASEAEGYQKRSKRWLVESRRGLAEIGIMTVATLAYFLIRGSVVDRAAEAFMRGIQVVHLERSMGIFWELSMQGVVLDNLALTKFFNWVYFWLHLPLILGFGLWLYVFHRGHYVLVRNAFLASGAIGLIIYNLFPVAPPRLMPNLGFVDTMAIFSEVSYQAQSLKPFVNPFAAIPSLHFGWALLMAIGIFVATRNPLLRAFAVSIPIAQFLAVVVTGNHFIIDAVIGAVVALGGLVVSWGMLRIGLVFPWERSLVPRRDRRVPAAGLPTAG